jgi:hypothetical protein
MGIKVPRLGFNRGRKAYAANDQLEIVQEIAAHFSDRLKRVGNSHLAGVQRFHGKHRVLNRARFL